MLLESRRRDGYEYQRYMLTMTAEEGEETLGKESESRCDLRQRRSDMTHTDETRQQPHSHQVGEC